MMTRRTTTRTHTETRRPFVMQLFVALAVGLVGCEAKQDSTTSVNDKATSTDDSGSNRTADGASGLDTSANRNDADDSTGNAGTNEDTASADPPTDAQNDGASNDTVSVAFEDIELLMQEDMVFRPFMLTERVRDLEGQRIRINGYMLPDTRTKGIKEFVLLKNTECKFGQGGRADHLINVVMQDGQTTQFRDDPISIEGKLLIKPFEGPDGNTWSIYDLHCDTVEVYRPERG